MAMILITHDLGVARGRTDEIMVMYGGRVMEHAATETLFTTMRHPYTEALLDVDPPTRPRQAHPPRHRSRARRPTSSTRRPGCRFAPRCRYAQTRCIEETPGSPTHGDDHRYACFFPVGTDAGAEALERNRAAGDDRRRSANVTRRGGGLMAGSGTAHLRPDDPDIILGSNIW